VRREQSRWNSNALLSHAEQIQGRDNVEHVPDIDGHVRYVSTVITGVAVLLSLSTANVGQYVIRRIANNLNSEED
jgi:hypothetical protein